MRRPPCEDQPDLFPADAMPFVCARRQPPVALPPLPFQRNQEIDVERAARILAVTPSSIHRMVRERLLRAYSIQDAERSNQFLRVEYASVLEFVDNLRRCYHLPPRPHTAGRPLDRDILPFPMSETITLEEVYGHLDISRNTALKLLDTGEISGYKLRPVGNSPWRIGRPSFVAYLHGLRRAAGVPDVLQVEDLPPAPRAASRSCASTP